MKLYTLLLVFYIFLSSSVQAQKGENITTSDSTKYKIITDKDKRYHGIILSDDGREICVQTEEVGKIFLLKSELKSIKPLLQQEVEVKDNIADSNIVSPFYNRYSFTYNSLPVKKGNHYSIINIYGPEVHFAISDRLNVGFVSTWMFSPMVLSARYSFRKKESDINFSIGSHIGTSSYINQFNGFGGMHWLSTTFGKKEDNISLSAGYIYMQTGDDYYHMPNGTYSGNSVPYERVKIPMSQGMVFSLAGNKKTGNYTSLIFDFMVVKYSRNEYDYNSTMISNYYYDSIDVYHPAVYQYSSEEYKLKATLFIGSIGMRYQRLKSRAFQISLVGISLVRDMQNNGIRYKNYVNIPAPVFSWFIKL